MPVREHDHLRDSLTFENFSTKENSENKRREIFSLFFNNDKKKYQLSKIKKNAE